MNKAYKSITMLFPHEFIATDLMQMSPEERMSVFCIGQRALRMAYKEFNVKTNQEHAELLMEKDNEIKRMKELLLKYEKNDNVQMKLDKIISYVQHHS